MFVSKKKYNEVVERNKNQEKMIEDEYLRKYDLQSDLRRANEARVNVQNELNLYKAHYARPERKPGRIITPQQEQACITHINKYLARIDYLEGNDGENGRRIPESGPEKDCRICEVFDYNGDDPNNGCSKCPLGPEFQACTKTPDFVFEFNRKVSYKMHLRQGRGLSHTIERFPNALKLKRRMKYLINQFRDAGLDIKIHVPKKTARKVGADQITEAFKQAYGGMNVRRRPSHIRYDFNA